MKQTSVRNTKLSQASLATPDCARARAREGLAWDMKKVDEPLNLQLRELADLFWSPLPAKPKLLGPADRLENGRTLQAAFESACADIAARPRRRGRPSVCHNSSKRTHQSFQAFFFVCGEMAIYGKRNSTKRIPENVRDAFIDFAITLYPSARRNTILEHIRRYRRYLPEFEEPPCLLLVRCEFIPCHCQGWEAKSIFVDVLVASPRTQYPP